MGAAPGQVGFYCSSLGTSLTSTQLPSMGTANLSFGSKVRAAFKHKTKIWSLTSSSARNATGKPFTTSDIVSGDPSAPDLNTGMALLCVSQNWSRAQTAELPPSSP